MTVRPRRLRASRAGGTPSQADRQPVRRTPGWLDAAQKWATVIAAVVATVGVPLLVLQFQELRTQNEAIRETLDLAYRQDVFEKTLAYDEFMLNNAAMYAMVRALPGTLDRERLEELLRAEPAKRVEAEAVATYILDFYDFILDIYPPDRFPRLGERGELPADDEEAQDFAAWSSAIRHGLPTGSYVCEVFQANRESYGQRSFVHRIDAAGLCRPVPPR